MGLIFRGFKGSRVVSAAREGGGEGATFRGKMCGEGGEKRKMSIGGGFWGLGVDFGSKKAGKTGQNRAKAGKSGQKRAKAGKSGQKRAKAGKSGQNRAKGGRNDSRNQ